MSEWRPIPGYEGSYDVSDQGQIRSWIEWRGRDLPHVMAPYTKSRRGHLAVILIRDGQRKSMNVHRAVLMAFAGNPPADKPLTRHLNGNPTDNRLANLAYGNGSQNNLDAVAHGTHFNASKTHCKRGHAFDGANTVHHAKGRSCRACRRERDRRRSRRRETVS